MTEFVYLTREQERALPIPELEDYYRELSKQPGVYVDFRGQRFTYPFRCLCCGRETHVKQWAYGRCCPPCDSGRCHTDPKFAHRPFSALDNDGHVTQLDRKTLLAPLSPDGDPDWLKRTRPPARELLVELDGDEG